MNNFNPPPFTFYPSSWSLSNPGVFSLTAGSSPSVMRGFAPGSSSFSTTYLDQVYAPIDPTTCGLVNQFTQSPGGTGTVGVEVTFSQSTGIGVGETATITATVTTPNNTTNTTPITLSVSPQVLVTPTTFTQTTNLTVKGNSPGAATITATVSHADGSSASVGSTSFNVVGPPDHLAVIVDNEGLPASCPTTGIYFRQMQMQVVDANNNPITTSTSIQETQAPAQPANSCGKPSPVPAACAPTNSGGTFLDTMAVGGIPNDPTGFCNTGINRSSKCGFSVTSTWAACASSGTKPLWVSPRVTHSDSVTVDGKAAQWKAGTQCGSTGCH